MRLGRIRVSVRVVDVQAVVPEDNTVISCSETHAGNSCGRPLCRVQLPSVGLFAELFLVWLWSLHVGRVEVCRVQDGSS
jgi:hypothetical protein